MGSAATQNLMRRLLPILAGASLLAACAVGAPSASAAAQVAPAHEFVPRQVVVKLAGQRRGQTLALAPAVGVKEATAALRGNPRVEYAEPNYIATASATAHGSLVLPNDPGTLDGASEAAASAGNWAFKQWNFLPWEESAPAALSFSPGGIDAIGAWENLEQAGRPGAEGVTVAVLDTGIAYRSRDRFVRSPDFTASQFVAGRDFIDDDRIPLDENGHGTHIAGTIAEKTDNAIAVTGLAYRAKLMPVRVLDRHGRGQASDIAQGIRFAVTHGAEVINMSFNFGCGKKVPQIDEALREAYARGVVAVASAGNLGSETCVSEPATGPRVIGVGGSTEGGCLGDYSLAGKAIDLVAPGGGAPVGRLPVGLGAADLPGDADAPVRPGAFAIPGNYVGTSMAAAHVSGVAAMVLAADTYGGPRFSPETEAGAKSRVNAVAKRLRETARDLGLPLTRQGAGLIDAAHATEPRGPEGALR